MSHTHFCDIAGHSWECESIKCICICQEQMEQRDHSRCPVELKACAEHGGEQLSIVHGEHGAPSGLHEDASPMPATFAEQVGCGRLKPIRPEIGDKFDEWAASERDSIGFCFICGSPIMTEGDLIAGTGFHNCTENRSLEETIRRGD